MSGFRQPGQARDQIVLWSQRLEDALPPDHPVRHLDYLLRAGALAQTFGDWERDYVLREGQPPYHPRDLSGLYIYGMLNRLRSSRQLEMACYNRLDVIWLLSGQRPDHATIAGFVKKHAARLRQLFREVLKVMTQAELVKLEHTAVDGTKIEADAGRSAVRSQASLTTALARVDAQVGALEQEWQRNESRESGLFGDQVPWTAASQGSLEQRLAAARRQQERLKKALESIESRQRESAAAGAKPPKAIAAVSDPDSRVMRDKEGRSKPNYNAQLAVDAACGAIVAQAVNDQAEDGGCLTPLLQQIEQHSGRLPQAVSADSQYNTGPELAKLEQMGVPGYLPDNGASSDAPAAKPLTTQALQAVQAGRTLGEEEWSALPHDKSGRITKEAFVYEPATDSYRCPMGQSLTLLRTSQRPTRGAVVLRKQYGGCAACATCPRAAACCRSPARGRMINRDQYEEQRERLRARMDTDEGRSRYRLRKQTVEPRIGYVKHALGIRRFLRRGLEAVRTEWSLICTAVNVGILLRHWEQVRMMM